MQTEAAVAASSSLALASDVVKQEALLALAVPGVLFQTSCLPATPNMTPVIRGFLKDDAPLRDMLKTTSRISAALNPPSAVSEMLKSLSVTSRLHGASGITADVMQSARAASAAARLYESLKPPEGISAMMESVSRVARFCEGLKIPSRLSATLPSIDFAHPACEAMPAMAMPPYVPAMPTARSVSVDAFSGLEQHEQHKREKLIPVENAAAFEMICHFEMRLRQFIDAKMCALFGSDWPRLRLPQGMLEKWEEKRRSAIAAGEQVQPLICYADFSDYQRIIRGNSNWRHVFSSVFRRESLVEEALFRLGQLRIPTMHSRPISTDDIERIRVETRILLRVIGGLDRRLN